MPPRLPASSLPPVNDDQRIELIDALRGVALAGVLFVNLGAFSQFYFLDAASRAGLASAAVDAWLDPMVDVLIEGKAISIFSMLFGVGFAMQLERTRSGQAGRRTAIHLRRMAVLLLIGAIHSCFWWGDILMIYAVLGAGLLAFRRLRDRHLAMLGLGLASFWFLLSPLVNALLPSSLADEAHMHTAMRMAAASEHAAAMLRGNFEYAQWNLMALWYVLPFVFSRFLLGYWAGRKGLLREPERHLRLLRGILAAGAAAGALFSAAVMAIDASGATQSLLSGSRIGEWSLRLMRNLGPLGLSLAYAAGFVLLYLRPRWQRWLRAFAPLGQMALTHYLLQSMLGIALFYGIGFGVGPDHGYLTRSAAWLSILAAQWYCGRWWLRRFRFGPMEWLWRGLTYGALPPLRR
jgi:uncharacterized protein